MVSELVGAVVGNVKSKVSAWSSAAFDIHRLD